MENHTSTCHVVAVPYPGRGHINPMLTLCKLISSKSPKILFSFVVTEEWHGFLSSNSKPDNIRFKTIPNVLPSELVRGKDFHGFWEALHTRMKDPFEQLLNGLDLDVNVIIADSMLDWVVRIGNRRNIPVASLWTASATSFSIFYHFDLLQQNGHFPVKLTEQGEEVVDCIPGIPSTRLVDFPSIFHASGRDIQHRLLEAVSWVSKTQYLLFTSAYELESQVIDAFKYKFPFPVLPLGPIIPFLELESNSSSATSDHNVPNYLEWLNSQQKDSVLYVSMGSFLSVSSAQMDEIIAGVLNSGVRFLWVSRGETPLFKDGYGDMGLVVPWCDQLRVLCHPSVGGFLTHSGWNSTLEGAFSGVPMLTCPISFDQISNSKNVVEDWKIGWRLKQKLEDENLVTREEITKLVKRFMDSEDSVVKEMRRKAKELRQACQATIAKGGSSDTNLNSFISHILQVHPK